MSETGRNDELRLGFEQPVRVRFGPGVLRELGVETAALGVRRVLLVTDPGVAAAGHAARARASLELAGLDVELYDQVREDPTELDVERCRDAARAFAPDCFVAVGGGSSIDTAKGANFLLTGGGVMADYRGRDKARRPLLPLVAVPTTAGTGSEMQSFALIADEKTHAKLACGDKQAAPRVALLDPELGVTQPRHVTACTGLDALAHAVESAVTKPRNERSQPLSRQAFVLAVQALPRALAEPEDVEARGAMLKAACLAGAAIEQSMLGAAHSLANPLSARYGLPHGRAVGTMLPHVVRFNAEDPEACAIYAGLAKASELVPESSAPRLAALELAVRLDELLAQTGLPVRLADAGVSADALPDLASEAAQQWTARFNPRAVDALDLQAVYRAAL